MTADSPAWPRWAARFLALSAKLVRVRTEGYPDLAAVGPVIFAHWHSEDLAMLPHFGRCRANILVSPSRNGTMLAVAVGALGYGAVRGSTVHGALGGLLALKKSLEGGRSVIFAADGPTGPKNVAKPGAVYLAAKTGRPIYPAGTACDRCHVFKDTWNKTRLPLPGARLAVVFGPPITIPPEGAKWGEARQSRLLTCAISDAVQKARLNLAAWGAGRAL